MKYTPHIHHRRSIRLKGYDYSQNGAYFITICAQNRECLFGKIKNGEMILNNVGKMITKYWQEMPKKYPNVILDAFVIMPNHVHGILIIDNNVRATLVDAQNNVRVPLVGTQGQPQGIAPTVGDIIGAFKSLTTNEYICGAKNGKFSPFEKRIWQRNYYEHIIRNEQSLEKIQNYIIHNPQKWQDDKFFAD